MNNYAPIDYLQDFLYQYKDLLNPLIDEYCSGITAATLHQIVNKEVDLADYSKHNWTLEKIFNGIEKSLKIDDNTLGKIINLVHPDDYFMGININHDNGEVLPCSDIDDIKIQIDWSKPYKYEPLSYSHYNGNQIQPGDILFSSNGFYVGDGINSGHCAIVDKGVENQYGQKYGRIIEANQYGVEYGLIDDNAIDGGNDTIIHMTHSTKQQELQALDFCTKQVGKDYSIPVFLTEDTDINTQAGYCSELVGAGYMSAGIDVQKNDHFPTDIPGIVPGEIFYPHGDDKQYVIYNDPNN